MVPAQLSVGSARPRLKQCAREAGTFRPLVADQGVNYSVRKRTVLTDNKHPKVVVRGSYPTMLFIMNEKINV